MSDYIGEKRKRSQNLLIVEGNHEKNELFWLIFQCFPEMNINMDDVWIYGTNIYLLYEDIVKEYGEDWTEVDIDLPFVISKKLYPNDLRYKEDFTNIIMVFDYERHDTNFSERKILEMQQVFVDSADMGKLYINYPMIESYQHLHQLSDPEYVTRKIPVSLQPGKEYKALVRSTSIITKLIEFPHKIDELLNERFGIFNEEKRKRCCGAILDISCEAGLIEELQNILEDAITKDKLQTAKYQMRHLIKNIGYVEQSQTYWNYMRDIFKEIIWHNICKANKIQNGIYDIQNEEYKKIFEQLDFVTILEKQNIFSRDEDNGFIWILSTCVFFVAEYNFSLVMR